MDMKIIPSQDARMKDLARNLKRILKRTDYIIKSTCGSVEVYKLVLKEAWFRAKSKRKYRLVVYDECAYLTGEFETNTLDKEVLRAVADHFNLGERAKGRIYLDEEE